MGHRQGGIMQAVLNSEDYEGFEKRVKILKDKGVELDYSVKVTDTGNHESNLQYQVILNGDYDLGELDLLTE